MNEAVEGIGDIATGALAAHELERASAAAGHDEAHGACLNCGAALAGPYCAACGQAAHIHRTLASLGHDFLHGVFHFEGKLSSTLPLLASRPGDLTRRYVAGERTRFVSPLALFLFSVFLLFAAISRLDLPDVAGAAQGLVAAKQQLLDRQEHAEDRLADLRERRADRVADGRTGDLPKIDADIANVTREIASLRDAAARVPDQPVGKAGEGAGRAHTIVFDTGMVSLDHQLDHVQQNPELYAYKLKSASYKYSWALIPISLPFIWTMFFWRRDVGMYDHAIFAIYSLAFMTLFAVGLIGLALLGVPQGWLWLAAIAVPPIHMFKQLRGAYRLTRLGALWRTAVLLFSTSASGVLFFALLLWLEAD